jgi:hypothetical protein
MLAGSFRLVTARLIPRGLRRKQTLLWAALILAGFCVAGCGGSNTAARGGDWQTVGGRGFRFEAPSGWKVERAARRVTATHDSELVQVATFPLLKPYDARLFTRVAVELRSRMREIAGQTQGRLSGERTVTADGVRSHAYDVTVGDHVDEYTFLLNGKREYLLLCRRRSGDRVGDRAAACSRLVTSFSRA